MIRSLALLFFAATTGLAAEAVEQKPETKLQAPAERDATLSLKATNRSMVGLAIETRERGGVTAHLDGRFRHALVLVIAPDGSRSIECVDSPEREAALLGVKPVAQSEEEE